MEKLKCHWLPALQKLLAPSRVIFRDDVPNRSKEGLPLEVTSPIGALEPVIHIIENGLSYFAEPQDGQKQVGFTINAPIDIGSAHIAKIKLYLIFTPLVGVLGSKLPKKGRKMLPWLIVLKKHLILL